MASNQKPKSGKTRNDNRKNGKAEKKNPGKIGGTGSSSTKLSPLFLASLNKGVYQSTANRAHTENVRAKSAANRNKSGKLRDE